MCQLLERVYCLNFVCCHHLLYSQGKIFFCTGIHKIFHYLSLQKHHESKKLYNLDDDEELTHYGQSLGEMTTFDDADLQLTDEENEEGTRFVFAFLSSLYFYHSSFYHMKKVAMGANFWTSNFLKSFLLNQTLEIRKITIVAYLFEFICSVCGLFVKQSISSLFCTCLFKVINRDYHPSCEF